EDEAGAQSMAAWAIHETRMKVERRESGAGRAGWTVTWKGRGWDRSLDEYLALLRAGRELTRASRLLVVPSVKYHLPRLAEAFRDPEYRYTTARLAEAWREPPLLVEKDFSPTLAGDALAGERAQIVRWLRDVPGQIRAASPLPGRLRERPRPHGLPASPGRVSRDTWLARRARATRARVSPGGRTRRWDARARGTRCARAPGRRAALPRRGRTCTSPKLSCTS